MSKDSSKWHLIKLKIVSTAKSMLTALI